MKSKPIPAAEEDEEEKFVLEAGSIKTQD